MKLLSYVFMDCVYNSHSKRAIWWDMCRLLHEWECNICQKVNINHIGASGHVITYLLHMRDTAIYIRAQLRMVNQQAFAARKEFNYHGDLV